MNLNRDIHPLTDFKHRTPEFVRQLKATGEPIVLTINGKAALVVQDAASYQKLLDLAEDARVLEGIRQGLEDMRTGRGRPAEEVFADVRRDLNIPHGHNPIASSSSQRPSGASASLPLDYRPHRYRPPPRDGTNALEKEDPDTPNPSPPPPCRGRETKIPRNPGIASRQVSHSDRILFTIREDAVHGALRAARSTGRDRALKCAALDRPGVTYPASRVAGVDRWERRAEGVACRGRGGGCPGCPTWSSR